MGRIRDRRDVIILGAGPAGSTAAIELARAGRCVLLIEKARFPRDKVCGGCLSGPAISHWSKLFGMRERLPGVATRRITFHFERYHLECFPRGTTRLVTRREFDARLAALAVREGVELRCGCAARLERGFNAWNVRLDSEVLSTDTILVATGIGGLVRRLGIPERVVRRRMIAQQWTQPAAPPFPSLGGVEMHWLRGGYVGVATPVADRCIVALATDAVPMRSETAVDTLRRLNPHAGIWDAVALGNRADHRTRGSAGFPWRPKYLGLDNVLLMGDAAGYEEPYTGEGMGHAMLSGTDAAAAVRAGDNVLERYTDAMHRRRTARLRRTRLIRTLLNTTFLRRVAAAYPALPHAPLARIVEHVHVRGMA